MGGGLMQLVAYGAQDIYLTGNRKLLSSRLSIADTLTSLWSAIQQTISGASNLSTSRYHSGTVTISRNGDLVHKVYVVDCRRVGVLKAQLWMVASIS